MTSTWCRRVTLFASLALLFVSQSLGDSQLCELYPESCEGLTKHQARSSSPPVPPRSAASDAIPLVDLEVVGTEVAVSSINGGNEEKPQVQCVKVPSFLEDTTYCVHNNDDPLCLRVSQSPFNESQPSTMSWQKRALEENRGDSGGKKSGRGGRVKDAVTVIATHRLLEDARFVFLLGVGTGITFTMCCLKKFSPPPQQRSTPSPSATATAAPTAPNHAHDDGYAHAHTHTTAVPIALDETDGQEVTEVNSDASTATSPTASSAVVVSRPGDAVAPAQDPSALALSTIRHQEELLALAHHERRRRDAEEEKRKEVERKEVERRARLQFACVRLLFISSGVWLSRPDMSLWDFGISWWLAAPVAWVFQDYLGALLAGLLSFLFSLIFQLRWKACYVFELLLIPLAPVKYTHFLLLHLVLSRRLRRLCGCWEVAPNDEEAFVTRSFLYWALLCGLVFLPGLVFGSQSIESVISSFAFDPEWGGVVRSWLDLITWDHGWVSLTLIGVFHVVHDALRLL